MKGLQVDTRDTKPKLRALAVATLLFFAAAFLAARADLPHKDAFLCLLTALYGFTAVGILLWAFREQIAYNPYSYNTVFYFGFALFALSVAVTHLAMGIRLFGASAQVTQQALIWSVSSSAKNYMRLSAPFIAAFSVALCVSNVSLIVHEGARTVNFLGILLSVLLLAGEAFLLIFDGAGGSVWLRVAINAAAAVYLYFECMLIGTIVADAFAARYEPEGTIDYMIILGCGIRSDGTLTPLLRARADRALAFSEKQKARTGKELIFVPSGGKGVDEILPESEAMARYLKSCGISQERILQENRSTNTYENMRFSKALIEADGRGGKVAFCTSNYHVFRSGLLVRRVKMRAVGIGARTRWYFWPNAAVREFVGLLVGHRVKQGLILAAMILIFGLLTVFS